MQWESESWHLLLTTTYIDSHMSTNFLLYWHVQPNGTNTVLFLRLLEDWSETWDCSNSLLLKSAPLEETGTTLPSSSNRTNSASGSIRINPPRRAFSLRGECIIMTSLQHYPCKYFFYLMMSLTLVSEERSKILSGTPGLTLACGPSRRGSCTCCWRKGCSSGDLRSRSTFYRCHRKGK